MDHEDYGNGGAFVSFRLDDGGDSDVSTGKHVGNLGHSAGFVHDGEAEIVFADGFFPRDDLPFRSVERKGGDAAD